MTNLKPELSDTEFLEFCGYESGRMNRYSEFINLYLVNRTKKEIREAAENAIFSIGYKEE